MEQILHCLTFKDIMTLSMSNCICLDVIVTTEDKHQEKRKKKRYSDKIVQRCSGKL